MSKLDKALGLGSLLAAAWRKVKDWRAQYRVERAKARAARDERELEEISDLANRGRGRCEAWLDDGTRCTRPTFHPGDHRGG